MWRFFRSTSGCSLTLAHARGSESAPALLSRGCEGAVRSFFHRPARLLPVALAAATLLSAATPPLEPHNYTIPPVTLIDMNGRRVQLTDVLNFRGPVFLQFIFTTCGTICPVMTAALEGVEKSLGPQAADVRMVSISIDPEVDTPARLRAFAKDFRTGPEWRLLTGTEAASIAVQKSFDAWWGNKMRHRPVTFLRPAGAKTWLRIEGLTSATALMQVYRRYANAGRRAYMEGIAPDGEPVRARFESGIELAGARVACANCHRPSGMGSTEGATLVPPIAAETLFQPAQPREADIFGRLFEEGQPAPFRAAIAGASWRPAYDNRSLAKALREGIDPTGRRLDPAMPRYRLGDEDVAQLIGWLKSLSCDGAPGVDKSIIRFATVVADETADGEPAQSMLAVMNAWVERRNRQNVNELSRQGRTAWFMQDFYRAYREWKLDVWKLAGPRDTWPGQLDAFYRRQPVFALIGGAIEGTWKPVGDFCERTGTPCLFPETLLPDLSPDNDRTIYFSKGLTGQAEALAVWLSEQGTSAVTQVYRGSGPADAFRAAFHGRIREVPVAPGQTLTAGFWDSLGVTGALVLWLDEADYAALPPTMKTPVYTSADLTGARNIPNAWLTWPWALPTEPSQDVSRVRGWLLSRRVPKGVERVQFDAWYTMALLDYSLTHMVENFSRDYLIETIENEAETEVNPGVYPELTLGPGQRFASRGAYIVKADGLRPVSGWIVP